MEGFYGTASVRRMAGDNPDSQRWPWTKDVEAVSAEIECPGPREDDLRSSSGSDGSAGRLFRPSSKHLPLLVFGSRMSSASLLSLIRSSFSWTTPPRPDQTFTSNSERRCVLCSTGSLDSDANTRYTRMRHSKVMNRHSEIHCSSRDSKDRHAL